MIHLYGRSLSKKFEAGFNHPPKGICINVKSPVELVRAMESQFPGFKKLLMESPYIRILRGDTIRSAKDSDPANPDFQTTAKNWYVIPVKCGGATALGWIAATFFTTKTLITLAFLIGVNLISRALASTPSIDTESKESFRFGAPENTSNSGAAIPIAYGEVFVGSQVASAGITVKNIDTNETTNVFNCVDVLCEGEIEGPANDDDWYKSTYLEKTQVKNDSDVFNFEDVTVTGRSGTTSQDYLRGFGSVESETSVSTTVTETGGAISRTITDSDVDDLRVKLLFNALIQTKSDGGKKSTSVKYRITVTPNNGAGTEQDVVTTNVYYTYQGYTYNTPVSYGQVTGKTYSDFQVQRTIFGLSNYGVSPWVIKVYRVTDDSSDEKLLNEFSWDSYTEIKNVKLRYPDTAVVGISLNAEDFRSIPQRFYKIKGLKIQIPSNYDPDARTYDGVWDGSFSTAYSNNPAWVLYDAITNKKHGAGLHIAESQVDKWALYTIGAYCDADVTVTTKTKQSDGSYDSSNDTEPRFTFNGLVSIRARALNCINDILSNFRAKPYWDGSALTFVQDKDKDVERIACPANVDDGNFVYKTVDRAARTNVVRVVYTDNDNYGAPGIIEVANDEDVSIYGENVLEEKAIGCTSRAQALVRARYLLYTNTEQDETITFIGGKEWADCSPGTIIGVQDPNYADLDLSGRITDSTTTSITLDRAVTLDPGTTYTVMIADADTRTITERVVTTSPGEVTVISWSTPMASAPTVGHVFIIDSDDVTIRKFCVAEVKDEGDHKYRVSGVSYNDTKFTEIETGVVVEPPKYTDIEVGEIGMPGDVVLQPFPYNDGQIGNTKFGILVSWAMSIDTRVQSYEIAMSQDGGQYKILANTGTELSYEVKGIAYESILYFAVRAIAATGKSPWVYSDEITVDGALSEPSPVTNLQVLGGGTAFSGKDCVIEWTASTGFTYSIDTDANGVYDDTAVDVDDHAIKYYKVEVYTTGDSLLRTAYTKSRTDCTYTYFFEDNKEDNASPIRSIKFKVYAIGQDDQPSTAATLTATNAAPDMSAITPSVTGKYSFLEITWSTPSDPDIEKYVVYIEDATPPTTAVGTAVHPDAGYRYHDVDYGTTYYVQIEPYDVFGAGTKSQIDSATPLQIPAESVDIELYESIELTDSDSNSESTLAALYDAIWDAGGVSYSTGGWSWIQVYMPVENFINGVQVWVNGATNVYVAYSDDGVTWNWLSGNAAHGLDLSNGQYRLTSRATEALCQTNYWTLAAGYNYAFFPNGVTAKYCRLYLETTSSHTVYELVFRRIVIAEDIAAESLSAIVADIGTVTAGALESSDWGATNGVQLDLDNKTLIMRKSSSDIMNIDADAGTGSWKGTFETTNSVVTGLSAIGNTSGIHIDITSTEVQFNDSATKLAYLDAVGFRSTLQPSVQVYLNSSQAGSGGGTYETITWDTEVEDQGNDMSSTTFTAPVTGRYVFTFGVTLTTVNSTNNGHIRLVTSNRNYLSYLGFSLSSTSTAYAFGSVVADMDASDTAYLQVYLVDSDSYYVYGAPAAGIATYMSVHLLA